jgi:hypothetical protein
MSGVVQSIAKGGRLPQAPLLMGRLKRGVWQWQHRPAHAGTTLTDKAEFASGHIVGIAVPKELDSLTLDQLVVALVPPEMRTGA